RCSTAPPGMSTAPGTTPAGRPRPTSTTTRCRTTPTSWPPSCTSSRSGERMISTTDDVARLIAALSLQEKVLLLTGADAWSTQGAKALGLRSMIMSDGPAGARGVTLDERLPSTSLPCPSALGATWDISLVRELASALGGEAKSKGIDV